VTISGPARSGVYEGGALAALVVASQALGEEVLVIDSIASASVASINDLLTARSLLGGVDPITLFGAAWVHNASFEEPNAGSSRTPLSPRTLAVDVLGPNGLPSSPVRTRQSEPVRLSMALSSLDSLRGDRPEPERVERRTGSTVVDWYSVELTNAASPCDYLALVHATSPWGPTGEATDDLSPSFDDATVEVSPLTRAIDLAEDIASSDQRLHLVLHSDPAPPSITPSLYDDLRRVETARAQIEWMERAAPAVGTVPEEPMSDTAQSMGAIDVLLRRQADVVSEARRIMTEREADRSDDYAALLDSVVQLAQRPENLRSAELCTVESRQNEFALGYRTMSSWLVHRLPAYLSRQDLSPVFDRINQEYERIEPTGSFGEGTGPPVRSFRGMATLGH
jgi:hypothetical protein